MGEGLFVEIDIVLDENMPLKESHDIGNNIIHNLTLFVNISKLTLSLIT